MDLTMLIGFAGGLAVLMSFAGVACGRLSTHSATYHAMNLAGALAMVAAGLPADAWPSVAVNVSWAFISAHGLERAAWAEEPRRRGASRRSRLSDSPAPRRTESPGPVAP